MWSINGSKKVKLPYSDAATISAKFREDPNGNGELGVMIIVVSYEFLSVKMIYSSSEPYCPSV